MPIMGDNVPTDAPLFHSDGGVTLVGDAGFGQQDLTFALSLAPDLVAADGGAGRALNHGHVPAAVYGDLDSLPVEDLRRIPAGQVHRIAEQDSTDFDKALRHIRAKFVLGVGFLGGRLDHELAVLNALVAERPSPCVLLGGADAVVHLAGDIALDLPVGTRLSLFPMQSVRGSSRGLRWPIDAVPFHPAGRIGTSNETVSRRVALSFPQPGMLLIVPRAHLGALMVGLGLGGDAGRFGSHTDVGLGMTTPNTE